MSESLDIVAKWNEHMFSRPFVNNSTLALGNRLCAEVERLQAENIKLKAKAEALRAGLRKRWRWLSVRGKMK